MDIWKKCKVSSILFQFLFFISGGESPNKSVIFPSIHKLHLAKHLDTTTTISFEKILYTLKFHNHVCMILHTKANKL